MPLLGAPVIITRLLGSALVQPGASILVLHIKQLCAFMQDMIEAIKLLQVAA